MKLIYAMVFLALLIFPVISSSQTVNPEKIQKSGKTRVNVPVSVADREGRYLTDLKKKDFTLFQDGVEQKITSFSTFEEPINVAILLDTSESTANSLNEIKEAAEDFIDLLEVDDKCLIATFDSKVTFLSSLTNERKGLKKAVEQVTTAQKDGSVLFDAIEQVSQKSLKNIEGRKVIIVLSDGKDFGSLRGKSELMSRLEESDVSIYSIFYQTGAGFNKLTIAEDGTVKEGKEPKKEKPKKPKKQKKNYSIIIPTRGDVYTEEEAKSLSRAADVAAVNTLQQMSDTTAGRFYQSDTQNLNGVFRKIAGELRQMYQLEYQAENSENSAAVRKIIVKVNRDDAVVRARGKFRAEQL